MRNEELYHWGIKLGGKSESHKYYERINLGTEKKPKYKYFYTAKEYQNYLNSLKKTANNIGSAFSKAVEEAKKKAKEYSRKGQEYFNKVYKQASDTVKKASDKVKEVANSKEVKAALKTAQKVSKLVAEKANKTYKEVSSFVSKNAKAITNEISKYARKTISEIGSNKQVQNAIKKAQNAAEIIKKQASKTFKEVSDFVSKNAKKISDSISKNINTTMSEINRRSGSLNGGSSSVKLGSDFLDKFLKTNSKNSTGALTGNKNNNFSRIMSNIWNDITDWSDKTAKDFKKLANVAKHILTDKEFRDLLLSGDVSKAYKDFIKDNPELKDLFNPKTRKLSDRADRNAVNPFYDDSYDYQTNCYSCSLSYDLRMKGFDVKAIPDLYGGMSKEQIEMFYKDSKFKDIDFSNIVDSDDSEDLKIYKMHQALDAQILAQAEGGDSTGFVTIWWDGGGGHIFNYVVENGKVKYIDTQPSSQWSENHDHIADIDEYLSRSSYSYDPSETVSIMRTDNLEINEKTVKYATVPDYIGNYDDADIASTESRIWLACNMLDDLIYDYNSGAINEFVANPFNDEYIQLDFTEYINPRTKEIDGEKLRDEVLNDLYDGIKEARNEWGAEDFVDFFEDFENIMQYLD